MGFNADFVIPGISENCDDSILLSSPRRGPHSWCGTDASHPPCRYESIILPGDDAWFLTELSNVVAYPCRYSRKENRHPCPPQASHFLPRFAWGGVRAADGGVMSISRCAHDPSGPSFHLPFAESAKGRNDESWNVLALEMGSANCANPSTGRTATPAL